MPSATPSTPIRLARPDDAGCLARFRLDLFTELQGPLDAGANEAFLSSCEGALRRYLETDRAEAWIAELPGGEPIGSLVLLLYPRLPSFHNLHTAEGYVISVYVAPAWRRRGIALSLMDAALEYGRRTGLARIRLHASPEGRLVYQRTGFRSRTDEMEWDFVAGTP